VYMKASDIPIWEVTYVHGPDDKIILALLHNAKALSHTLKYDNFHKF
jgi:hypothetical protein